MKFVTGEFFEKHCWIAYDRVGEPVGYFTTPRCAASTVKDRRSGYVAHADGKTRYDYQECLRLTA